MKKLLVAMTFMALCVVSMAAAQDNKGEFINGSFLIITDVDVKVCNEDEGCDTDKDLNDGDKVDDEIKPGGTVEFDIEVTNIFPDDGDEVEIEDIEIEITIEGIDDDDDLEEDADFDDLDPDDEDSIKVKFDIPLEVDEDDFDVIIEIDGDSDNGSQEAKMKLSVEVEKEDNEVRFTRFDVAPSTAKCGRTVSIDASLLNTGGDNEDDVLLEVTNADLDINFRDTFDLDDDPFDDDARFRNTYRFTVPDEADAGIYPIQGRVVFDDGSDVETELVELTIESCSEEAEEEEKAEEEDNKEVEEEKEDEEEDNEVVVVRPNTNTENTNNQPPVVVTPPQLPSETEEEESVLKSSSFLTLLIVGEVLLVIIAIVIIVAVMRRRD